MSTVLSFVIDKAQHPGVPDPTPTDYANRIYGTSFAFGTYPRAIGQDDTDPSVGAPQTTYIRVFSNYVGSSVGLTNCMYSRDSTDIQYRNAFNDGIGTNMVTLGAPSSHYASLCVSNATSLVFTLAGLLPPGGGANFQVFCQPSGWNQGSIPSYARAQTSYGPVVASLQFAYATGTNQNAQQVVYAAAAGFESMASIPTLNAAVQYAFAGVGTYMAISHLATLFQSTNTQINCVAFVPSVPGWSSTVNVASTKYNVGGDTFTTAQIINLTETKLLVYGATTAAPTVKTTMLMTNVLSRTDDASNIANNNVLDASSVPANPAGRFPIVASRAPGSDPNVFYVLWWGEFDLVGPLNAPLTVIYTPDFGGGSPSSYVTDVSLPVGSIVGSVLFAPRFISSSGTSASSTAYFLVAGNTSDEIVAIKVVMTPTAAVVTFQAQADPFAPSPKLLIDVGVFLTDTGVPKYSITTDLGTFPTCTVTTAAIVLP